MKVNIMLHEIVNSISKYQRDTEENFWKKISSESIEEFLIDYHLPKEITTSIITDYADLKKLLVEDVTEIDRLGCNILDSADVDLVTDILMFSYLYGNSVQVTHHV